MIVANNNASVKWENDINEANKRAMKSQSVKTE